MTVDRSTLLGRKLWDSTGSMSRSGGKTIKTRSSEVYGAAEGKQSDALYSRAEVEQEVESWFIEFGNFAAERQFEVLEAKFQGLFQGDSLVDKINGATVLLGELNELNLLLAAKPWTLLLIYRAYHVRVEWEIGPFLERADKLSVVELLRLYDFITAYNTHFKENLPAEVREDLPPNTFPHYEAKLLEVYASGLESMLGSWVCNIATDLLEQGTGALIVSSDGKKLVRTNAPVDLLRIVCETLKNSSTGGNEQVERVALAACLSALSRYLEIVEAEIVAMQDLGFLCALANDCAAIVDYIDSDFPVAGSIEQLELVSTKYTQGAVSIVKRLVDTILCDLRPLCSARFTNVHCEGKREIVDCLCATLQDYYVDLEQLLRPMLFQKMVQLLSRDVMASFFAGMLKPCGRKVMINRFQGPQLSKEIISQIKTEKDKLLRTSIGPIRTCISQGPLPGYETFTDIVRVLTQPPEQLDSLVEELCEQYGTDQLSMLFAVLHCVALRADLLVEQYAFLTDVIKNLLDSPHEVRQAPGSLWLAVLPADVQKILERADEQPESSSGWTSRFSFLLGNSQTLKSNTSDGDMEVGALPQLHLNVVDQEAELNAVDEFIQNEERLVISTMKVSQLKALCKSVNANTSCCLTR